MIYRVLTINQSSNLPLWLRCIWPFVLRTSGFIKNIIATVDTSEPLEKMQQRLSHEFLAHLGTGPFLGGRSQPTLADLSAFPILIAACQIGLTVRHNWLREKVIHDWFLAVSQYLPQNILPIQSSSLKRSLKDLKYDY